MLFVREWKSLIFKIYTYFRDWIGQRWSATQGIHLPLAIAGITSGSSSTKTIDLEYPRIPGSSYSGNWEPPGQVCFLVFCVAWPVHPSRRRGGRRM